MQNQQPQDDENLIEEEDALVQRMEAVIMAEDDREERLSFADSERFDEDDEEQYSVQASESSSLSHHWRGWANASLTGRDNTQGGGFEIPSLRDLAARRIAASLSFELIESTYSRIPHAQKRLRPQQQLTNAEAHFSQSAPTDENLQDYLPEQLVLLILKHCFPESTENIRLYSCLTNCGDRLFALGERLFQNGAVSELFQIGYHLSAKVREIHGASSSNEGTAIVAKSAATSTEQQIPCRTFDVCIRVDRCNIVWCACSCSNASFWCQHAVATCLQRIQRPDTTKYRPAIWDSITSLRDKQLKKLAQYLINELPREYIPIAQKLMDELRDPHSEINCTPGAPDPTAGPTDDTPAVWCMDGRALHEEVRKTLINFMRPSAMVCEVQSLLSSPPALAHEWSVMYRTICADKPESIWNLIGMVRVMLTRGDANGPTLLHVLTQQCLALDSVLLRWYQISLIASGLWHITSQNGSGSTGGGQRGSGNAQQSQSRQLLCYLLCQEIVSLWRLIALNPRLNAVEREQLWSLLRKYQHTAVSRVWTILGKAVGGENTIFCTVVDSRGNRLKQENAKFERKFFPGFFAALQACRQFCWTCPEGQRLVHEMDVGSRLGIDIQLAQRHSSGNHFPNLPFLRDTRNDIVLIDMVEMERQLGNASIAFNPDAVLVPSSKSSKRRKKHKKALQRQKTEGLRKEGVECGGGGSSATGSQIGREGLQRNGSRRDSKELSDDSTDDEQLPFGGGAGCSGVANASSNTKREHYEDALDTLFAEAHAELDDPSTLRFMCCEALFGHGYFYESLQLADALSANLLANQPNLLLTNIAVNVEKDEQHTEVQGEELPDAESSSSAGTSSDAKYSARINTPKSSSLSQTMRQLHFRRQFSSDSVTRFEGTSTSCNINSVPSAPRALLNRSHPRLMAASLLAKETMWRTLFLAKILLLGEEFFERRRIRRRMCRINSIDSEAPEPTTFVCGTYQLSKGSHRLRALELCLETLRNLRGPAATRLLEMEINQLESDLFSMLHRLELCPTGLNIVRSLAKQELKNQASGRSPNSVTVPPTRMAHYMLNALTTQYSRHQQQQPNRNATSSGANQLQYPPCHPEVFSHRVPADDSLALELALQVLGTGKAKRKFIATPSDVHISERDHPLLCECIRRNRKDLLMVLLSRNRDSPEVLARVMATILDQKVHHMYEEHNRTNVDFFLPSSAMRSATSGKSTISIGALIGAFGSIQSSSSATSSATSPSSSPFDTDGGSVKQQISGDKFFPDASRCASLSTARPPPVLANQASEAQAHHMFEFAKSLLLEAGGNQSSSMFNPVQAMGALSAVFLGGANAGGGGQQNVPGVPHRNLHICSLLIALYALGLNNECSLSWNTRTYSTHVSWIHAQALDIGSQALEIIRLTWRKHFTPTEVASLADKASQSNDRSAVEAAAHLALSVLPEANSLLPAESLRALDQCKERSSRMLEEACLAVEKAAERGGVYPEVLFQVAHYWHDLYKKYLHETATKNRAFHSSQQQQQDQPVHAHSSHGQTQYQQPPHLHHSHHHQQQQLQSSSCCPHTFQQISATPCALWSQQASQNNTQNWLHAASPPQPQQQNLCFVAPPPPNQKQQLAIFSPSIPPPPLPQLAPTFGNSGALPLTGVGNNVGSIMDNSTCRMHVSLSVPNMTIGSTLQQQQQGHHHQQNLLPQQFHQQPSSASASIAPLFTAPPNFSTSSNYDGQAPPPIASMLQQRHQICAGFSSSATMPPPPICLMQQLQQSPGGHQQLYQQQQPVLPFAISAGNVLQQQQQHQISSQQRCQQPMHQPFVSQHHFNRSPTSTMPPSTLAAANRFPNLDARALHLLLSAHRLGIAAMNNLRSSESLSAKFAQNPPSCYEICWLLDISLEIGDIEYLRLFCEKVIASVGSPFVLVDLLKGIFKFFQHVPNSHRIPGTGQLEAILQATSGDLAKLCMQQAKSALQHSVSGIVLELTLHAIGAAFAAACHKLNFNNFNAPDQEYVCELAVVTRDLFRLIPPPSPPYHHDPQHPQTSQSGNRRKYMDLFMEHMQKQKCFKKFKSVQSAVQSALQQQQQLQQQHQSPQQRQQHQHTQLQIIGQQQQQQQHLQLVLQAPPPPTSMEQPQMFRAAAQQFPHPPPPQQHQQQQQPHQHHLPPPQQPPANFPPPPHH